MTVLIDYTKGFFETTEGDGVGTVTGNATLDLSTGSVFSHTPTANTTFALTNPPASGTASSATLKLTGANVTSGYDIANLSYDNVNFSVASQETNPTGVQFKPDGTKMYITGNTTNDAVYEYDLSTAWDVSTASYNQNFSFTVTGTNPQDLFFKPDGTKMFVVEGTNATIDEYNLSTAWDISTASYSQSGGTTGETQPRSLFFKPDGTRMFVGGRQGDDITQYDLSTAWDVSTASGAGTFYVAAKEANPFGFAFNNDGTTFYVTGSNGAIQEYNVQSAAYSVVNGQFVRTKYINGSGQTSNPTGLAFKDDGTKVYSIGNTNDRVAQFSTSSSALATITYPSSVIWSGGTTPTTPANGETDVYTFYTDDGGTTYYGFQVGDALA